MKLGEYVFSGEASLTKNYHIWRGFKESDQTAVVAYFFAHELFAKEAGEKFLRDAHILAQKEHPGILIPLAAGRQDGRCFVVYPDIGAPISSFDTTTRAKPKEVLSIALQVVDALVFAEGREVSFHGHISPDNIIFDLKEGQARLALFGVLHRALDTDPSFISRFKDYRPRSLSPDEDKPEADEKTSEKEVKETGETLKDEEEETTGGEEDGEEEEKESDEGVEVEKEEWMIGPETDLYGLGLVMLDLLTGEPHGEILGPEELSNKDALLEVLGELDYIPMPVQEVLLRLLAPQRESRYEGYKQAREELGRLLGKDRGSITYDTFIFSTLFGGRFKPGSLVGTSACSRLYKAKDEEGEGTCLLKIIDLREYPILKEPFRNFLKQMATLEDHTLVKVRDVGTHFELGYIAMDEAGQSLEDLLIRRGMLPLQDAAHIVYQITKALEFLYFHNVQAYGGIKTTNIFLSANLGEVRIGDVFLSRFLLENGNLANTSAEYLSYSWLKDGEITRAGDFYQLGLIFYELLVGHPPYSFKVEDEIIRDHIEGDTMRVIQEAMISPDAKQVIMRLLDRNPASAYRTPEEIRRDIAAFMGWDKKEKIELPHIPFDFADVSIVGKNTKEKVEETLCYRLPAKGDRPRGFFTLLHGEGREIGDASGAVKLALDVVRESIFTPGGDPGNPAALLGSAPQTYLENVMDKVNKEVYRFAFRRGKLGGIGVSLMCGFIQDNTLFLLRAGENVAYFFSKGEFVDVPTLKGALQEERVVGERDVSLEEEPLEILGFGERFKLHHFKKRLKDGEQVVFLSGVLRERFSAAEIREFITSQDNPAISIELVEKNARRRRLEGTISAVLVNVGEITRFLEDASHRTTGNLARSYMESADQLLQDGKVDDAIRIYQRAIEHNPNYTTLHFKLGKAFKRSDLEERALGSFLKTIELDGKHIPAHTEAAMIYLTTKQPRQARNLLETVLARGVEDAEVYAHLALVSNRLRRTRDAIRYARRALELKPGHPLATQELLAANKGKLFRI